MRNWQQNKTAWLGVAAFLAGIMLFGGEALSASQPAEIAASGNHAIALVAFSAPLQQEAESEHATAEHGQGEAKEPSLLDEVFHWFNFLLILGGIVFLVKKVLVPFLEERGKLIREDMDRSAKALADATERLAVVEYKLNRMDEEMASLRQSAFHESAAERERIEQAATADAGKIIVTAEQEIEAAVKTARQELKVFTSELALRLAEKNIRNSLTPGSEQRILRSFVEDLSAAGASGNGKKSAGSERKQE
jgi:F0F1-type ATP synthase membrane subunit b/b'